eukprot:858560-Rhodomonas_salina.2
MSRFTGSSGTPDMICDVNTRLRAERVGARYAWSGEDVVNADRFAPSVPQMAQRVAARVCAQEIESSTWFTWVERDTGIPPPLPASLYPEKSASQPKQG